MREQRELLVFRPRKNGDRPYNPAISPGLDHPARCAFDPPADKGTIRYQSFGRYFLAF